MQVNLENKIGVIIMNFAFVLFCCSVINFALSAYFTFKEQKQSIERLEMKIAQIEKEIKNNGGESNGDYRT